MVFDKISSERPDGIYEWKREIKDGFNVFSQRNCKVSDIIYADGED